MPPDSIDIIVQGTFDPAEFTAMIHQPGLLGSWSENQTTHVYWDPHQWRPEFYETILQALQTLGVSQPANHVSLSTLPGQDWNAQWARQVTPIRIGRRVRIRPSWASSTHNPEDIELVLDPKQAFGTGHHATTQLLVEWLEDVILGGETLLDIGTGSGILSMVGLRLGVKRALGLDTDPQAITCAIEYSRLNRFGPELELVVSTLDECPISPWDIITANIDRRTLLALAGNLGPFLSVNGMALISGLLKEDQKEIVDAFVKEGWSVQETREKEEWLALKLQRSHPSERVPLATVQGTQ